MNRALPDEHRLRAGSELLLWLFAGLALLITPGRLPLFPGEQNWLVIASRMTAGRDLLAGTEGHYALLNSWLAALPGVLGGWVEIPLWLLRMPSILMAGLLLFGTMSAVRQLWNEQAALTAGWLLAGSVGFLWFGRMAIPAVASAAAAMLAFCVCCREPERRRFGNYFGFYLLFFAGAWCGGLPTQLTVMVMMIPFLLHDGRWRRECCWQHLTAFLIGAAVYCVPFCLPVVLADLNRGISFSGCLQAVGEVMRLQFQAGDWFMLYRQQPFAILVSVALPYFPLITFAVFAVVRGRVEDPMTRRFALSGLMAALWLLIGPAAEFGLLLLLPLFIVLTAAVSQEHDDLGGQWFCRVYAAAAASVAVCSLLPICLVLPVLEIPMSWSTLAVLPLCGSLAVVTLLVNERHPDLISRGSLLPLRMAAPVLALALLAAGIVCWALPEWYRRQAIRQTVAAEQKE
ncbi:MAG: hypothetical protein IJC73_04680 [Lentisphaeria bacterium]|nr:hypothetical protein [Lentisphaeria bacterium]